MPDRDPYPFLTQYPDGMKLVSAILPTRGRSEWAKRAVECFLAQDYRARELIIVDDLDDKSFDYMPDLGAIDAGISWLQANCRFHYRRLSERLTIPQKRNRAIEEARGEIIAHFDSDDWSAPDRLSDQVQRLNETGKAVTGYHSMMFYDVPSGNAYRYVGVSTYAIGTSLCYRRGWWSEHRFDERLALGEDNKFVQIAAEARELSTSDAWSKMVARVHADNSFPKNLAGREFRLIARSELPDAFFHGD